MSSSSLRNDAESGFTLIEVLIALFLLMVISLAIFQATTQTYRLRDILMHEGEFYNGIRLAMGVMERDVNLIYSPTLILPEKQGLPSPADAEELQGIIAQDSQQTSSYWGVMVDKSGVRPSRFIGTDSKISFVSTSNIRVYKESPESEFAKVAYGLQDDKAAKAFNADDDGKSRVLVKDMSPNAFSEDDSRDTYKRSYPLLHGVTKIRFRYYRKDKDQWLSTWDSEALDTKDRYPDIVEVALEVEGPSRLHFEGTYKLRPEIPLRGIEPSS